MNTLKKMKTKMWTLIMLATILSGCVTKKKCSEKFPMTVETETIIRDTVIFVKELKADTVFSFVGHDTVFITDTVTKIKTKIIRLSPDSFRVKTICPPDTIFVPRYYEKTTTTVTEKEGFANIWWWVVVVVGLFGIGYVVNSLKK